jgi:hypothetical protein
MGSAKLDLRLLHKCREPVLSTVFVPFAPRDNLLAPQQIPRNFIYRDVTEDAKENAKL